MNRLFFFGALAMAALFQSCTSNEIGNSKDVNPETVYFDYKVNGDERSGNVTVMLQYRFGGPNGTTLVLQDPSLVKLDGDTLRVDSSRYSGAYYEDQQPVRAFTGDHTIEFTDLNKKVYTENFHYEPMAITDQLPAKMKRGDLVLNLTGVKAGDLVRVVVNDTAFSSEGINRVDTLKDNRILISKADMAPLVEGPIKLELYRESEKPVRNGTPEGGRLFLNYELRRQFELKN